MNRDKLKDAGYFEKYLQYQDVRLDKFISLANQAEKIKGLSDAGTQRALGFVTGFMTDKLYASYSCGKPIEEIRQIYAELVEMDAKRNTLSYRQLIDIASFAILLRADNTITAKVIAIIKKARCVDILLEGFCSFLEGKGFVYNAKDFKFRDIYADISAIVSGTDKNKQIDLLVDYIKNHWYDSNKESAWHDSHKSEQDVYVGYWCFEGLALAVALGLETSRLNGLRYIPNDLI
jgi:hypothetical protein